MVFLYLSPNCISCYCRFFHGNLPTNFLDPSVHRHLLPVYGTLLDTPRIHIIAPLGRSDLSLRPGSVPVARDFSCSAFVLARCILWSTFSLVRSRASLGSTALPWHSSFHTWNRGHLRWRRRDPERLRLSWPPKTIHNGQERKSANLKPRQRWVS